MIDPNETRKEIIQVQILTLGSIIVSGIAADLHLDSEGDLRLIFERTCQRSSFVNISNEFHKVIFGGENCLFTVKPD